MYYGFRAISDFLAIGSPSALVRLYQCVQLRRQHLSNLSVRNVKSPSFSAPSELISNCFGLSEHTVLVQSVRLCQNISLMQVQNQYLSKFVSEKGNVRPSLT